MPSRPRNSPARQPNHSAQATIALLLLTFACLGLTACGSSQSPVSVAAARSNKLYRQERDEALDLVNCARGHGIPLPAPNSKNAISTVGINLNGHRRKAALSFCYQKASEKAAKEHEEERVREGKPAKEAPTDTSTQGTAAFEQEREHLLEVVSCARRHGIHLPEPDAHNNINTRGFNLKSHRNSIVMSACFREVVNKASREQEELAREQQAGPRRLGEKSTG
jgi:hypothetical protein